MEGSIHYAKLENSPRLQQDGGDRMIDLEKFCGASTDKRIGRPWSDGEFTMATNGHIMIRVPRRDDVEENPKSINISVVAKLMEKEALWLPVPVVPVTILPCDHCKGTGKTNVCPECDGEGEVTVENDYNEYEVTCQTCSGKGGWKGISNRETSCKYCEGTGKDLEHTPVNVNGVLISDLYLSWIAVLPNAEIAVFGPNDVVRFRFNGGDGFVMPRRA